MRTEWSYPSGVEQGPVGRLGSQGPCDVMQNTERQTNPLAFGGVIVDTRKNDYLTPEEILARPGFRGALVMLAEKLCERFMGNPRLGRALGSHQRWLLSQAAFALYMEFIAGKPDSGLTVGRLRDLVTVNSAASRNTVLNFLEEMRHYRYVADIPPPEGVKGRRRFLQVSETAEQAMLDWFRANLLVLDTIDGGNRLAALAADPSLFARTQPVAARACLQDRAWLEPPPDVALFEWTDGGGMVSGELVMLTGTKTPNDQGRICAGAINVRKLADNFLMSHTHLQRLFRKAAETGVVGWSGTRRKSDLWVSKAYIDNYQRWQAVKFSHLDRAFRQAEAETRKRLQNDSPCLHPDQRCS